MESITEQVLCLNIPVLWLSDFFFFFFLDNHISLGKRGNHPSNFLAVTEILSWQKFCGTVIDNYGYEWLWNKAVKEFTASSYWHYL